MMTPAEKLAKAAQLTADDSRRRGSTLELGNPGKIIYSGDTHGHRMNLAKVVTYFKENPGATLILQEIIHGELDSQGLDRSMELLVLAAELKCSHPDNVHFVVANHDAAQFTGGEITKEGRSTCLDFKEATKKLYPTDAFEVYSAAMKFLRSLPLAIRTDNRVMLSHTLPSPNRMKFFDPEILSRPTTDADFQRGNSGYEFIWGRNQTPEQLDRLSEMLDADFFLIAHRHLDEGLVMLPNRGVSINSNTNAGRIIEFDSNEPLNFGNITQHIKRVATL